MNETITRFTNCKVGQLVRINDVDLLIELDEHKKGTDFLIKEKRILKEDSSKYVILTLDHVGTDLEYLVVCSSYLGECDILFYKKPDFFKPDKRQVIQESDNNWLFSYDNYPHEIYSDDIIYDRKFKNEVFDNVCFVEWETESQIVDYKLLLIETGIFNDGGGWVEFYEGRQIQTKDITL